MPLAEDVATTAPPTNVAKLIGPGLLVAAAGLDGVGRRGAYRRRRSGHREPDQRRDSAIVGRRRALARWRRPRARGRVQGIRESDEGAYRHDVLRHHRVCAVVTFHDPRAALRGLLAPAIPSGGGSSVLSVLGGIGGSIAMLAYNYWLREEKMAFRPAPERVRLTTVASTPYRVALLFITLVPIPFAFVDRPRAASRGTRHLPTQCWSLR
jgi:hypothetical protein